MAPLAPFSSNAFRRFLPRIPKGFQPKAQGCEERATLGESTIQPLNPNGVVASSWPLSMLIVAFGLILTGRATAQTFTTLYSFSANGTNSSGAFTNRDGANPYAGLTQAGNGNIRYGTTSLGGSAGAGTIFAINTDGTGFT